METKFEIINAVFNEIKNGRDVTCYSENIGLVHLDYMAQREVWAHYNFREICDKNDLLPYWETFNPYCARYEYIDECGHKVQFELDPDAFADADDIAEMIANDYTHLEQIEITSDKTGYPRGLNYGFIGFKDFDECEKIGKLYGLTPQELRKRDGWTLWNNYGLADGEYDLTDFYTSDGKHPYFNKESLLADIEYELQHGQADDGESLFELREKVIATDWKIGKVFVLDEDWSNAELADEFAMQYREDVWTYAIGLDCGED